MLKFKYIHTSFFIALLAVVFSFSSCKEDGSEGPAFADMNAEFGILDTLNISKNTVDFASGETVYFTGEFVGIESWTITIRSADSASIYTMNGKSKKIDASNSKWNGSADALPSFSTGTVTATLTIDGESYSYSKNINVTSKKALKGAVIMEFPGEFIDPIWPDYYKQATAENTITKGIDGITSPLGDYFYYIGGVVNWDWGIGGVGLVADYLHNTKYFEGVVPVANAVFFNAFVYSDTTNANKEARLMFQIQEDDNNNGKYDNGEDQYDITIDLDWVGWKVISVPYDTLTTPSDPDQGVYSGMSVAGNELQEPHKISKVVLNLVGNPAKGKALMAVDYIVLTNFEPLKP
jgi:hypothetical protein